MAVESAGRQTVAADQSLLSLQLSAPAAARYGFPPCKRFHHCCKTQLQAAPTASPTAVKATHVERQVLRPAVAAAQPVAAEVAESCGNSGVLAVDLRRTQN